MANLDLLLKAWDSAIWEFTLVFEGLSDEDLWRRPHPKLLSVGELAGHVSYWAAVQTTEPPIDRTKNIQEQLSIKSPLVDPAFQYYSTEVDNPVTLELTTEEVLSELKRVLEFSKSQVTQVDRKYEDKIIGRDDWTWGNLVEYQGFHVAYHAGQAYSVRHLLGHTTTDN